MYTHVNNDRVTEKTEDNMESCATVFYSRCKHKLVGI